MRFLNHSASLLADAKAINSEHIVDSATHVCFLEAHEMAPPQNINTHPLVEELSSLLDIQVASEYPSKTRGSPR